LVARRVDLPFFFFPFSFFSFCFLGFLHDICHDGCLKGTAELRVLFFFFFFGLLKAQSQSIGP
jgi:hypothetical protein